jgi:hypothetical protein
MQQAWNLTSVRAHTLPLILIIEMKKRLALLLYGLVLGLFKKREEHKIINDKRK